VRWVITGANRGIGLELVKQLARRGDDVEALAREPQGAVELNAFASEARSVRVHRCDVLHDGSVREMAGSLGDVAVDVLINNAGVMGKSKVQSLFELDMEDAAATYDANALGPLRVTRALFAHLKKSSTRRLVSISSGLGSLAGNESGGMYGYRMAKAALNMANRSLHADLRPEGFTCVVMNPGWVRTDMGGQGGEIAVDDSAARMIAIIDRLTIEQSGSFLDYRGGTIAW